ncbi:hypothetical protein DRH27_02365 [Candidatus Falkowbacteria bacterium]|nr:MAG: hypothetical protein DRH27_02365 [Candidatus Falkowbacteria bacterium]
MKKKKGSGSNWEAVNESIREATDIVAVYEELGAIFVGGVKSNGWAECHAMGRDDKSPSAGVCVTGNAAGRYVDHGGGGSTLSLFDAMAAWGSWATWKDARAELAKRAGIKLPTSAAGLDRSVGEGDPLSKVKLDALNIDQVVRDFARRRNITTAAFSAFKLRTGIYHTGKVIVAFPTLNPDDCGFLLFAVSGMFQVEGGMKDRILSAGSVKGFITWRAPRESTVVWVEGPTDALALWDSMTPGQRMTHGIVSPSGGARAGIESMGLESRLAGKTVLVIGDRDRPGQTAAIKFASFALDMATTSELIVLPFDITENKGKDTRDYLTGGDVPKWFRDVLDLPRADAPADLAEHEQRVLLGTLAKIGVEPIGHDRTAGVVAWRMEGDSHLYQLGSAALGRMDYGTSELWFPGVTSWVIPQATKDTPADSLDWVGFKRLLTAVLAQMPIDLSEVYREGIHQGDDGALIVVSGGRAGVHTSDAGLTLSSDAAIAGRLVSPDGLDWVDMDALAVSCDEARGSDGVRFRRKALNDLMDVVRLWNWDGTFDANLAAGLILASLGQAVWAVRPQIILGGGSGCGKTTFLEAIESLVGLVFKSGKSSLAGIRQSLAPKGGGVSGRIPLLDEFEVDETTRQFLELVRLASRGETVAMGTQHGIADQFGFRHCFWLSAIDVQMKRAPDRNRFVRLELGEHPVGAQEPDLSDLGDLRVRLIASVLTVLADAVTTAKSIAVDMPERFDGRQAEVHAVPVSILSAMRGEGEMKAADSLLLVLDDLAEVDGMDAVDLDDGAGVLTAILTKPVPIHGGLKVPIGRLVNVAANIDNDGNEKVTKDSDDSPGMRFTDGAARRHLATLGMKIVDAIDGPPGEFRPKAIFIRQSTAIQLTKGTAFEGINPLPLLRRSRVQGVRVAVNDRRRVDGGRGKGLTITLASIEELLEGDSEGDSEGDRGDRRWAPVPPVKKNGDSKGDSQGPITATG